MRVSGNIVNIFNPESSVGFPSITLPFPIIEGMSGSPILTYCNGTKIVGLARGNRNSRILASEIIDFQQGHEHFKETIHRVVEYGLAHHAATIVSCLEAMDVTTISVSSSYVKVPFLED
jgi:hypothetical protein